MTEEEKHDRFSNFVKEHSGIVSKLCRGYTNSKEDFEDVVQEVYYQLWRSIDRFEQRSKASTWVYRLTLNVCLYHLSRQKKKIQTVGHDELEKSDYTMHQGEDNPENQIDVLYRSIALLKPIDRAIIMLYLEKKEHSEIAEVVGLSISNVGVRVNRIKKKLRKIVDETTTKNMG